MAVIKVRFYVLSTFLGFTLIVNLVQEMPCGSRPSWILVKHISLTLKEICYISGTGLAKSCIDCNYLCILLIWLCFAGLVYRFISFVWLSPLYVFPSCTDAITELCFRLAWTRFISLFQMCQTWAWCWWLCGVTPSLTATHFLHVQLGILTVSVFSQRRFENICSFKFCVCLRLLYNKSVLIWGANWRECIHVFACWI